MKTQVLIWIYISLSILISMDVGHRINPGDLQNVEFERKFKCFKFSNVIKINIGY